MSDENGTISNATFTKCQHCGTWTNYAGDEHYKFRQQEFEQLRVRIYELNDKLAKAYITTVDQAKLIRVLKGALSVAVTDEMVGRFMAWKLPAEFYPDAGISFYPLHYQQSDGPHWPTGTNLFTAEQARAMLEYVLTDEVDDLRKGKE